MTQTEQQITGKAAAAAVAKKMLEQRIALVTALGNAIDAHRRASDTVTTATTAQGAAADAVRTAHADAISGGWTAGDLRDAGLVVPPNPRRKRTPKVAQSAVSEPGSAG